MRVEYARLTARVPQKRGEVFFDRWIEQNARLLHVDVERLVKLMPEVELYPAARCPTDREG